MKRSEYLEKLSNYEKELARQDSKHSTGSMGKLMDVVVRDYILVRGITRANDVRCRKLGSNDVSRKGIGAIEIKTGSGAVAYGEGFTAEDCTAENILPDAVLVCWAPFTQFLNKSNFMNMTWVFTRSEFIETLTKIGKNGLASSLKVSKQDKETKLGRQINIQTITPRMEDRLWEVLENMPTLEEYFQK